LGDGYERGIFLVEIRDKDNPNIKHISYSNGKTDNSDEIPNRFFSQHPIGIGYSKLKSFKDTIS